jgi:hypothetical protein
MAQTPVSTDVDMSLIAICEAYRAAENSVAWYSTRQIDTNAARISRQTVERFRLQLREQLARLVIQ